MEKLSISLLYLAIFIFSCKKDDAIEVVKNNYYKNRNVEVIIKILSNEQKLKMLLKNNSITSFEDDSSVYMLIKIKELESKMKESTLFEQVDKKEKAIFRSFGLSKFIKVCALDECIKPDLYFKEEVGNLDGSYLVHLLFPKLNQMNVTDLNFKIQRNLLIDKDVIIPLAAF